MDGRAIDLPGKTPWPSNPQIGDSARVYFLEAIGLDKIKIGASEDVADRCRVIQGLSPVPLSLLCHVPGGEQLERSLHERFSHLRSHGEWFYATPELREFIKALAASQKTA
jgi:hypothetical protein